MLVRARRVGLKSLVVGSDGRASTSKLQAVLWTYAILFVLLYMLVLGRTLVRTDSTPILADFDEALVAFLAAGFRPEYVALLGLPLAGAVAAKGITSGKVASAELFKPMASSQDTGALRGLAETVCNDSGQTDLLDFQYFAFNLVALLYFFVTFGAESALEPAAGLPEIPATLLALSGVSATTYLVKKQLESGLAPVITAVTPMRVRLGQDLAIRIEGDGFLAEGRTANSAFNQVLLGGRPLAQQDKSWQQRSVIALLPTSDDRAVLEGLGWRDGEAELIIRDDRGTSSPHVSVEVELPPA